MICEAAPQQTMSPTKVCLTLAVIVIAIAVVSASMVEQLLKVPLFEIGGLWFKAAETWTTTMQEMILSVSKLSSFWTCLGLGIGVYVSYRAYILVFANMNRIRLGHEVGYCADGKLSTKDVRELVKRKRKIGSCPPCYPNGWFSVIDSHDLKTNEVKSVSCLGEYPLHLLTLFRRTYKRMYFFFVTKTAANSFVWRNVYFVTTMTTLKQR